MQGSIGRGLIFACSILILDAVGVGLLSLATARNLFSYYTLVLLLESAFLLFTGGFRRRPSLLPIKALETEKKSDWSLIVTGLILLALSFILAYPLK